MFNSTKKGNYCDLSMEHKLLLKIHNENLLPKGGGGDQPSLDHKVFLHFFMTKEKANVPKYIFRHMIKTLKESQTINRCWVPYERLLSEIIHQGGILDAIRTANVSDDKQLGTVTGKVINGGTLRHMKLIKKEDYKKLATNLKQSKAVSNLMVDFPPICLQDPLEVSVNYIMKHYETTGKTIEMEDVPEKMFGGALPVASEKKRKLTKEEYMSEVAEEASEPKKKKAKKTKVKKKKVADDVALEKALQLAKEIEVPAEVLMKESRVEGAQLGIELTKNLQ